MKEENKYLSDNMVRYRCDQIILNRIDSFIVSHAETKREIKIEIPYINNTNVKAEMTESIVNIHPENMNAPLQIINEIDFIKCNICLILDHETGKISRVTNLDDIKYNWEQHKQKLCSKINSICSNNIIDRKHFDQFINLVDENFKNQETFILDLTSKIFFDVFFDKYLLGNKIENEIYNKTFYSYLFDKLPITIQLTQSVTTDKETGFCQINNYITNDDQIRKNVDINRIREIYKQRYQPTIKYCFTKYNYNFNTKVVLGNDNLPTIIEVNIVEEIENNIELVVVYKIHKLK